MPTLTVAGSSYDCTAEETVLDALQRHGVEVPNSCRKGACQSCMMRVMDGAVPAKAQAGLKKNFVHEGYFLACQCRPDGDLTLASPNGAGAFQQATIVLTEPLADTVQRVVLRPETPLRYRAGQFVNLRRPDGLIRSYSLASLPGPVPELEIHVQRLEGGAVSDWICDTLKPGSTVEIGAPMGTCFYLPAREPQNMLLIGTGTGLAPLFGIARDALLAGHQGDIHFYHGSRTREGLYFHHPLRDMHAAHGNFHYHPCVSGRDVPDDCIAGRADDIALHDSGDLAGWRVFLCGLPEMVHATRKQAYLKGASLADIHADAFELAARDTESAAERTAATG
jgi:ferredoxin-NADP reductase/ferredoxin